MSQHDNKKLTIPHSVLIPEITALVNEGHKVTLPLRGYSMRPFLEDGRDKALLVKPDYDSVKCGDVALANINGSYVLHRIIRISGDKVTLLGDGNLTPEHCLLTDIKAVAIGFYRHSNNRYSSTTSRKWRIYSSIWMVLRPVRRYLLAIYRRLYALKNIIKKDNHEN